VARYPDFDQKLAEQMGKTREQRQDWREKWRKQGLRNWWLARMAAQESHPPAPWAWLRSQHPRTVFRVALSLNRMVEEKYPDLHQRWTQRPSGESPLAFGSRTTPHLGRDCWNVVASQHGSEMKEVLPEFLGAAEAEVKQHPERPGQSFEALLKAYPQLPSSWLDQRLLRASSGANG